MRIGLDFDGVIADNAQLKQEYLKEVHGVDLEAQLIKREVVVGRGLLTNEQYDAINRIIAFSPQWNARMRAVPQMVAYLPKLIEEHEVCVITNRSEEARDLAEGYLRSQGIAIPVYGVGKGASKATACKGLEVFIDDDLDKLEGLIGVVPHRYLMSWKHNESKDTAGIATRVHNWEEFYRKLQEITKEAA